MGEDITYAGFISLGKILILLTIYFSLIILFFRLKSITLPHRLGLYIWPSIFILLTLTFHHLLSQTYNNFYFFISQKELLRLMTLIIIFCISATASYHAIDHIYFIKWFTMLGIILSSAAIYDSVMSEAGLFLKYTSDFLRAGEFIGDANLLGAFLNICSVCCLAGFIIYDRWLHNLFYLLSFIFIQTGRIFTFSTGSLLNFIITLITILYLLFLYNRIYFYKTVKLIFPLLILTIITLSFFNLYSVLFYRLDFSNEYIWNESIMSRVQQYKDYYDAIKFDPLKILFGFGIINTPLKVTNGLQLHNSYLRALANGGIVTLLCFFWLIISCFNDFRTAILNNYNDRSVQLISILFLSAYIGWSFQAATIPSNNSIVQWFFFILAFSLRTPTNLSDNINRLPVKNILIK